jgi:hypothetical protein
LLPALQKCKYQSNAKKHFVSKSASKLIAASILESQILQQHI